MSEVFPLGIQEEKQENLGGRPTVMTEEGALRKLEEAFKIGATDLEACYYAGITPPTLYKYQRENPEFVNKKTLWKQTCFLKARKAIFDGLGEPGFALKFMERKKPEEFARRTDITSGNKPVEGLTSYMEQYADLSDEELDELIDQKYEQIQKLRKDRPTLGKVDTKPTKNQFDIDLEGVGAEIDTEESVEKGLADQQPSADI